MYYVYMLLCEDGSHYTGLCRDVARRMQEHAERRPACAKYTRTHHAIRLDALWRTQTRSDAARLEALIKTLPKQKKLALIERPDTLGEIFAGKLDPERYESAPREAYQDIFPK